MQGRSKGIREDIILLRSKGQYSSANLISDGYRDELIKTAEFLSFSLRERILKSAQWFESQPPKSDFISSEETVGRTPIKCWYIQLPWIWKFIVFWWANQIEKPNLGRFLILQKRNLFSSVNVTHTLAHINYFDYENTRYCKRNFKLPNRSCIPVIWSDEQRGWLKRQYVHLVSAFFVGRKRLMKSVSDCRLYQFNLFQIGLFSLAENWEPAAAGYNPNSFADEKSRPKGTRGNWPVGHFQT